MSFLHHLLNPSRALKLTSLTTLTSLTYITYRLAERDPPGYTNNPVLPILDPTPPWAFTRNFLYPPAHNPLWSFASATTMTGIGLFSKAFLALFTTTTVHNLDAFLTLLNSPTRTRAIITVSNHTAITDDPLIWGVLPAGQFSRLSNMRWVLGAAEICFKNPVYSVFFSLGQLVPIVRGMGINQRGIDYTISNLLNTKKWVHVFPEARVNQTGLMIRFKWGVARLIMEANEVPIVVPIWHRGFERVFPEDTKWRPKLGRRVEIAFGEPIEMGDLVKRWREGELTEVEARMLITQKLFDAVEKIGREIKGKAVGNSYIKIND